MCRNSNMFKSSQVKHRFLAMNLQDFSFNFLEIFLEFFIISKQLEIQENTEYIRDRSRCFITFPRGKPLSMRMQRNFLLSCSHSTDDFSRSDMRVHRSHVVRMLTNSAWGIQCRSRFYLLYNKHFLPCK